MSNHYSLVPNQSCVNAAAAAAAVAAATPNTHVAAAQPSPAPAANSSTPGAAAAAAAAAAASSYVNLSTVLNQKDSRWLQLEVCREFQRNKCTRPDFECKFAHPGPSIEVQSGKVTACYDSIKGRCNRDKPPCKYFHPPQHLKDQLLINGRNHLALKNAIMQHVGGLATPTIIPNQPPSMVLGPSLPPVYTLPIGYLGNAPAGIPFGYSCDQYATMGLVSDASFGGAAAAAAALRAGALANPLQRQVQAQVQAAALAQQSASSVWNGQPSRSRSDRVEVCREFRRGFCTRSVNECRFAHPVEGVNISEDGSVTICMDHEKGRCARDPCRYFHRPEHMKASSTKALAVGGGYVANQGPPAQPGHPVFVAAADPQRTSAAAAAAAAAAGVNASLLV